MLHFFKTKSEKQKSLGRLGEEFAQREYEERGYKVVASNFFNRQGLRRGEVDFIAADSRHIAFVEVKTRRAGQGQFGGGAEAVDRYKQQKLLKAVKLFLLQNPRFVQLQPRIDVCVVMYNELDSRPFSATILANAVEDNC